MEGPALKDKSKTYGLKFYIKNIGFGYIIHLDTHL